MRLYSIALVLIYLARENTAQNGPTVFAVGPNILRTDADETVSVILFNVNGHVPTSVFLQDYPDRTKTFSTRQVNLENNIPKTVSVKMTRSDLPDVDIIEEGKARYVYLVVQSDHAGFKFKHETVILVHPSSGHVFIQTDKPLYNPMQQVKIRVIPVGQDLHPVAIPIRLDILNPQGIIVQRRDNMKWNGQFISDIYQFIENPTLGNWTVRASYGNDFLSEERVIFEVKDYSLPVFQVKIVAPQYFLIDSVEARGYVEARYLYGQPVKGVVLFKFGVFLDGEMIEFGTLRKELSERGIAGFKISSFDIEQTLGEENWFPEGGKLYIRSEVIEKASGHREVEEDLSCNFVRSPYVFTFTRSSKFFKPALSYKLKIDARFTDGKPAKDLKVKIVANGKKLDSKNKNVPLQTRAKGNFNILPLNNLGQGTMTVDMVRNLDYVDISVTSLDVNLADNQQSVGVFNIRPYVTPSNSFIIIQVQQDIAEVGELLKVQVLATHSKDITRMNFLVMSRGTVVATETIVREAGLTTTAHITVTPAMVPSVRVVAYYIKGKEVIADSIWVDVVDRCEHEVTIEADMDTYQPDKPGELILRGDPNTLVGLLAVDEAVYLLNTQDILTRKHMFNVLETFDLGCGPGGGENSSAVFQDSGLSVVTSADLTTDRRHGTECHIDIKNRRRREAVDVHKNDRHRRTCCGEGIKVLDVRDCYKRASELQNATQRCRSIFYECCKEADQCRTTGACNIMRKSGLARAGGDQNELDMFPQIVENEADLTARTHFPESWLFESVVIGPHGVQHRPVSFPSSITRWVVQAVSVSPNSGLCVATPRNITVFKEFFVDVRLPARAVRNEQLEVKVTIYNYYAYAIRVVIYMVGVDGICSEAPAGKKSEGRRFQIEAKDAQSTTYPIIPLELGPFKIRVTAFSAFGGDVVEKVLNVVAEGQQKEKSYSLLLDPGNEIKQRGDDQIKVFHGNPVRNTADRKQTDVVKVSVPVEAIKGTANCRVSATGSVMGPTVQTVVGGIKGMLRLPTGCGEQTMIGMAPTVYAMAYLTSTKQTLTDDSIEKTGHDFIQKGYDRELAFRKADGSFAVWAHHKSSSWLTAFVLKVFCQAREYADIEEKVICSGVDWLASQQTQDGKYVEPYKVYHREMIGGVNGDVSLTAFVLIALQECSCRTERVSESMKKAVGFLEGQLDNIERPFAFAIISYALALVDSPRKIEANEALCTMSVYDEDKSTRYWPVGTKEQFGNQKLPYWFKVKPTALSVETTAYALLAQLTLGKVKYSNAIVNWLTQHRNSKGAFVSTQDTVIALQALSKYAIKTYSEKLDLTSHLTSNDDPRFKKDIQLSQENALVQKLIDKVPFGSELYIETQGTGVGQMQVTLTFNIPADADTLCRFQLEVVSQQVQFNPIQDQKCDVCGQECEDSDEYREYDVDYDLIELPEARSGASQAEVHKKRSRIGRDVYPARSRFGGKQNDELVKKDARIGGASKVAICIEACTRSLTGNATGMSIIEVGLFTGFIPIDSDLKQIVNARNANKYEISSSSVIFYVDSIPEDDVLCVKFRAKQEHHVGNIQPVAVNVYDYYNPEDDVCTKFYKPESESGLLQTRCDGDVCKCVEGKCNKCYSKEERRALKPTDLKLKACEEADYVFRVHIDSMEDHSDKLNSGVPVTKITATLKEHNIIKEGGQKYFEEDKVVFWKVKSCSCPEFEVGKEYLVMGKDGQRYVDEDRYERFKYYIDHEAFVMEFFDKRNRALNIDDRRLGHYMGRVSEELSHKGCPT